MVVRDTARRGRAARRVRVLRGGGHRGAGRLTPRIRTDFPRAPTVREGIFIALADGTRLAARIWLPEDADDDPVPAVLEYLPYRLNDGTASRRPPADDLLRRLRLRRRARRHPRHRRVRRRAAPTSTPPQEQADCLEVIAWLAEQPWCTGAVGMMGYSWSGFNALQVAALRPPALKAIASCFASRRPLRRRRPLPRRPRDPDGHGALVDLHARLAGAAARPRGRRRRLARDVARAARAAAVDRALAAAPAPRRLLAAGLGARRLRPRSSARCCASRAGPTATPTRRCG